MELCNIVDHDLDRSDNESEGDDTFYAELERRIIVLINTPGENDLKDSRTMRRITNNYSSHRDKKYFDWTEAQIPAGSVPTTILNLWKSNVGGTGVFIPHSVKSDGKNKRRMFSPPLSRYMCSLLNNVRIVIY